jgi:hypothetical protein
VHRARTVRARGRRAQSGYPDLVSLVLRWGVFAAILFACGGEQSSSSGGTGDGGTSADGSSTSDGSNDATDPDSGIVAPASVDCAPLPAPSGTIVDVTPAQANELATIVQNAAEGTTIRLADGVYKMTVSGESARRLQFETKGVTMRSASGKRDSVVIDAEYQTNEPIVILASNVTIAHLTVTHAIDHPILKLTVRESAGGTTTSNLEGATSALFVDATKGDLHLVSGATSAIDKATVLPDPGLDIDGKEHDVGAPDIGADEHP